MMCTILPLIPKLAHATYHIADQHIPRNVDITDIYNHHESFLFNNLEVKLPMVTTPTTLPLVKARKVSVDLGLSTPLL